MQRKSPQLQIKQKGKNPLANKQNKKEKPDLYIQDEFPFREIRDGYIETEDNRLIKIIEILPQNYLNLEDTEQESIINILTSYFKIAPQEIQIKSVTKRADIEKHVRYVNEDMRGEVNPKIYQLANAYLQKVQETKELNAITSRFFIIITSGSLKYAERSEIIGDLEAGASTVRQYFKRAGNEIVSFNAKDDEDEYLHGLLYMLFNRRSSSNESYAKRREKIEKDLVIACQKYKLDPVEVVLPLSQIVAPRGIDFTHPNYFVMDGLYYCIMYIESDGYRQNVPAAWLSVILNSGGGMNIDVDVHIKRTNRSEVLNTVKRQIRLNKITVRQASENTDSFDAAQTVIDSSEFIKEGLQGNELYYVSTFITIMAPSLKLLDRIKANVKNNLRAIDFDVRDCVWTQEKALHHVLPLCYIDRQLYAKTKMNMLSDTVAAMYPFTSFEMCDETGIWLGTNKQNKSLIIHDPFNTRLHRNANCTVIAPSGMGKTYFLSLLALRARIRGIKVFIIAPVKADEFRRVCTAVGGSFISLAPSSSDCINIMEIRNVDRSVEALLSGEEILAQSMLMKKIEQINTFASLQVPDMTYEEMQIMDEAIHKTYERFGMTTDNVSLFEDKEQTRMKRMPILGDLHETLESIPGADRLARIFRVFTVGSAVSFNGQTNVDLSNKFTVLNLEGLSKSMTSIGMFTGLDYVWDIAKSNRTEKKFIIIDEVYQLIGAKASRESAAFVEDIYRLIRGYGGGAVSATQDIGDFLGQSDGKFAKAILNNSATKMIMGLSKADATLLSDTVSLTTSEIVDMAKATKGQGMLITSVGKVSMDIIGSPMEHMLITTDAKDMKALATQRAEGKSK